MSMTVNSIAKNQMGDAMIKLSTMKRINSAADDAAGLAIAEKIDSQIKGLEKGIDNTLDMQNLLKTAEGGLSGIDDSLQRIRELSLQATNSTYTDDDRAIIQNEIGQLIQGIDDIAKGTQYNGMNLLDGSFTNRHTASSADGSGASVSISDMSTSAMKLDGYDVTKAFDIGVIDDAINMVSETRSYLGTMSNRLDHTVNSNSVTLLNQIAAKSRIADLDVAQAANDLNRGRVLNEMQIFSQKKQQDQLQNPLSMLL